MLEWLKKKKKIKNLPVLNKGEDVEQLVGGNVKSYNHGEKNS